MNWLPVALQIGGTLLAIGIAWGTLNSTQTAQQRALDDVYRRVDAARLDGLSERVEGVKRDAASAKQAAEEAKLRTQSMIDRQLDRCQARNHEAGE
jgi:hypothetical protein